MIENYGRFVVHQEDYDHSPEIVRRLLAGMIVTESRMNFASRCFEYTAENQSNFARVESHMIPPMYVFEVVGNRFCFRRSEDHQKGIWELFNGKTPILIEQEKTCCTVRMCRDMRIVATGLHVNDAEYLAEQLRKILSDTEGPVDNQKVIELAMDRLKGTQ